MLIFHNLT